MGIMKVIFLFVIPILKTKEINDFCGKNNSVEINITNWQQIYDWYIHVKSSTNRQKLVNFRQVFIASARVPFLCLLSNLAFFVLLSALLRLADYNAQWERECSTGISQFKIAKCRNENLSLQLSLQLYCIGRYVCICGETEIPMALF